MTGRGEDVVTSSGDVAADPGQAVTHPAGTAPAGPPESVNPTGPVPPAAVGGRPRSGVDPGSRTDTELLHAHVAGDRDAFAELFHRHRDRLWAVALRTISDREEAADALQDALLSAHRAAARFRGDAAVTTWLHRIVVNACLDRIRRRQAHPTVPLPDGQRGDEQGPWTGGTEPAAPATDHDTALVVRQALAELPVEQRAALILVDVQGYPVAEAARILDVAEGTVKSRCARGRARLALRLGHLRGGSESGPTRGTGGGSAGGATRGARDSQADVPPVTRGNRPDTEDVGSERAHPGRDPYRNHTNEEQP